MGGLDTSCISAFQIQVLFNHITHSVIIYDFWLRHSTAVSFGRLGHWKNSQKFNLRKPILIKISKALSKLDVRAHSFLQWYLGMCVRYLQEK